MGNRKQKPITKKLAEFHNQFVLLTMMGGTEQQDFVWEVLDYKTLYGRHRIIRLCMPRYWIIWTLYGRYRITRLCMGGTELQDFVWEVLNYKTSYGKYRIIRLCMGST